MATRRATGMVSPASSSRVASNRRASSAPSSPTRNRTPDRHRTRGRSHRARAGWRAHRESPRTPGACLANVPGIENVRRRAGIAERCAIRRDRRPASSQPLKRVARGALAFERRVKEIVDVRPPVAAHRARSGCCQACRESATGVPGDRPESGICCGTVGF